MCQHVQRFLQQPNADLVDGLTAAEDIFGMNSIKKYYSALNMPSDFFKLQLTNKEEIFKILGNVDLEKVLRSTLRNAERWG